MKTKLIVFSMLLGISAWAEPNKPDAKLWALMQRAVLVTKDIHEVQGLLDRGIDINAPIGCGTYSPLDGAVSTANVEMLKFLLAHGAKPQGHELVAAAFESGGEQSLQMVEALLQAGVEPNARDRYNNTALHQATYRGHRELIRLLLSQNGIDVDAADEAGETALMCAVRHGSSEIVDLLLQAGAKVQIKDENGLTAAVFAEREIEKQRAIMVELQSSLK